MNQASELPTRPGRREIRKQERRAAIVAVARDAFLRDGYAAMSMTSLLQTLGGSKSTLWAYFPSKEQLFAAVLENAAGSLNEELSGIFVEDRSLEDGIVAFCRAFIATIETPEALAIWRLIVGESERFPELGLLFYREVGSFTERKLGAFLERFIGTDLRKEDPREMARMLLRLCSGYIHERFFGVINGVDDRQAIASQFAQLFLRVYGAAP